MNTWWPRTIPVWEAQTHSMHERMLMPATAGWVQQHDRAMPWQHQDHAEATDNAQTVPGQCPDSARTVPGQCPDSARTVPGTVPDWENTAI